MTGEHREKVQTWTKRLNEALHHIRRPFAYRVGRAIEAYVANYPRMEEDTWLQWAFADQIEQKILPKFRGLDPAEPEVRNAFGLLNAIVDELDDQPLLKAIQSSRSGHQFVWQGVPRTDTRETLS